MDLKDPAKELSAFLTFVENFISGMTELGLSAQTVCKTK